MTTTSTPPIGAKPTAATTTASEKDETSETDKTLAAGLDDVHLAGDGEQSDVTAEGGAGYVDFTADKNLPEGVVSDNPVQPATAKEQGLQPSDTVGRDRTGITAQEGYERRTNNLV